MAKGFLDGYKTYDTSVGFGNPKQWRQSFKERMSPEEAERIINAQEQTQYQILGILPGATKTEIKKAYRKAMKQWHPDNNQHREAEAVEQSKLIIAAFETLSK